MEGHEEFTPSCPFCEFSDSDTYFLAQHVELCHPENGYSPFIALEDDQGAGAMIGSEETYLTPLSNITPSKSPAGAEFYVDTGSYVECPAGCGEAITVAELPSHLDLHSAEDFALEEMTQSPRPGAAARYNDARDLGIDYGYDEYDEVVPAKLAKTLRDRDRPRKGVVRDTAVQPRSSSHRKSRKERLNTPDDATSTVKQLGKAELGPHANERQMPAWLYRMLEEGAPVKYENKIQVNGTLTRVENIENETKGLIPVLAQLCELDESVERAFLCNPNVRHVFKMPKEGGFCGYRNIQMLISYLQDSKAHGSEHFPGRIPSILKLQDMIEHAWDMGYNSNGRIETGGIKGTRKYIGTSEAQALFDSLGINCEPAGLSGTKEQPAVELLLAAVADYFLEAITGENDKKVLQTNLPPIYFQHPGHSLTIVGFEVRKNNSLNLLVFDPMFKTSPAIMRLIDTRVSCPNPNRILKAHRRCNGYLGKYDEFEILKLLPPPSES